MLKKELSVGSVHFPQKPVARNARAYPSSITFLNSVICEKESQSLRFVFFRFYLGNQPIFKQPQSKFQQNFKFVPFHDKIFQQPQHQMVLLGKVDEVSNLCESQMYRNFRRSENFTN